MKNLTYCTDGTAAVEPIQEPVELELTWDSTDQMAISEMEVCSVPDALIMSLSNRGCVDMAYMETLSQKELPEIVKELKGAVFQNPETWEENPSKGWEVAEEYLSGNLVRKWNEAKKAARSYPGRFRTNCRAIEKVMPPAVCAEEIYVTLGSPWVPAEMIDDFILHMYAVSSKRLRRMFIGTYPTRHDELTGTWEIPCKNRFQGYVADRDTFGTKEMGALHILQDTLNMKSVAIYDEIPCSTNKSGRKRVLNRDATLAATEKQTRMIREFQSWVWQDEGRKQLLEAIFERQYSCVKRRCFDGSFLQFPTMNPDVKLFDYQKNAVARILFSDNTLLAHDVGSGKTYVMIAAGQELRRMHLAKKLLYVVPNNIVGQWESIFHAMYPDAKLLVVEPKTFTPKRRQNVLAQIRDGDFDGILMAYSCFDNISVSKAYRMDEISELLHSYQEQMNCRSKATSGLEKKYKSLEKEWNKLHGLEQAEGIFFDELGIDRLFVDEAHNYKNVPLEKKADRVLGLSGGASKKCEQMLEKVRIVQKQNGGRGVVMATGTPITNSITDAYVFQKYLQPGELALLDLQSFDSWIGMFAERKTEFEIDVDTSTYRLATRFSMFHNLPELTSLLSSIADFHQMDKAKGIPDHNGREDILIPKSPAFAEYLKEISKRAEDVRKGYVRRNIDNMLKITTDGRKAALDMRLVQPEQSGFTENKAGACAENAARIFFETEKERSAQLIFCDTSTPKAAFNLYHEVREQLIDRGVPYHQIAFVHDADTEASRTRLFAAVRTGEIRILMGSTFKLGLGVNVQDRLIALHHLDVPWRPADMTQREGRILRQGNRNQTVQIFRYITEGSFDAYSWQLLETKQRFISDLLSGSLTQRTGKDVEDTVLDYAEVKALAVGNPLIKQRVETANLLHKTITLQKQAVEQRLRLKSQIDALPARMENQKQKLAYCREDAKYCAEWKAAHPEPVTNREKQELADSRKHIRAELEAICNRCSPEKALLYRGFTVFLMDGTGRATGVWLKRKGSYYVELGDKEVGNLIRIDNVLDNMDRILQDMEDGLTKLKQKKKDLQAEWDKPENYAEDIQQLTEKLQKLDQELGVENG